MQTRTGIDKTKAFDALQTGAISVMCPAHRELNKYQRMSDGLAHIASK